MNRLVLAACVAALSSCSVIVGPVSDCRSDADCKALEGGADLVCDTSANVCTYKGCVAHADCTGLGAGYFCEAREGVAGKTCVQKTCTAHADCAPLGDDIVCSSGACLSACAPAKYSKSGASADREVKVGAILPLTAADGTENASQRVRRWSIELATKELNAAGGVVVGSLAPRAASMLVCDSHADPDVAARLGRYLSDNGRRAILTTNTAETARVLAEVKSKNSLVMSVSATATRLSVDPDTGTPVDNGGLFFRTAPRDDKQARALVKAADDEVSGQPVLAVIHESNDYGRGLAAGVAQTGYPAAKLHVTQVDPASPTAGDFATLGAATPRFVLIFASAQNAAAIVKAIQGVTGLTKGPNVTYVFADAAMNTSLIAALGTDASLVENARGTLPFVDTSAATYSTYRGAYNALRLIPDNGGVSSALDKDGTFGPHTYDATYLLFLASMKAIGVGGPNVDITGKTYSDRLKELSDATADDTRKIRVGPDDLRKAGSLWASSGSTQVNVTGTSGAVDFDAATGDVGGAFQWCQFNGSPPTNVSGCLTIAP